MADGFMKASDLVKGKSIQTTPTTPGSIQSQTVPTDEESTKSTVTESAICMPGFQPASSLTSLREPESSLRTSDFANEGTTCSTDRGSGLTPPCVDTSMPAGEDCYIVEPSKDPVETHEAKTSNPMCDLDQTTVKSLARKRKLKLNSEPERLPSTKKSKAERRASLSNTDAEVREGSQSKSKLDTTQVSKYVSI